MGQTAAFAAQGAAAGAVGGPIGMGIGAGIGALAGKLLGRKKDKKIPPPPPWHVRNAPLLVVAGGVGLVTVGVVVVLAVRRGRK